MIRLTKALTANTVVVTPGSGEAVEVYRDTMIAQLIKLGMSVGNATNTINDLLEGSTQEVTVGLDNG